MEEIDSCHELQDGEERNNPIEMARIPSDRSVSTVLDMSRSQSESSDYHSELSTPSVSLTSTPSLTLVPEESKTAKLYRIRDCLGLLRELFFMSKQTIPMEQRFVFIGSSLTPE